MREHLCGQTVCMSLFVAPYPLSNGGWGWGDLLQSWRNGVSFTVLLSSPFVFIFIHQSLLLCPLLLSFSSVLLPFFFFLLFCVFICPFTFQFFTFSFLVCPLLIFPLISHYPRRVISTLICPLVFIIYSLFLSSLLLSLCLLFNPWFSSSWGCPLLFFALFIHVEFSFFQCSLLIHFPLILLLRPLLPSSYFYFLPSSPLFHLALIFLFTHALYISPLFFFLPLLSLFFSLLSSIVLSSPLLSSGWAIVFVIHFDSDINESTVHLTTDISGNSSAFFVIAHTDSHTCIHIWNNTLNWPLT